MKSNNLGGCFPNIMRFAILIIALVWMFFSCTPRANKDTPVVVSDTIVVIDTIVESTAVKSLEMALVGRDSMIRNWKDSALLYKSRIRMQDFKNSYALNQIQFYSNLCDQKPSNKKFLHGWVKRALSNR